PAGRYEFVGTDISGKYFESVNDKIAVNGKRFPGGLYVPNSSANVASVYSQSNFSIKDYPQVKVHHSYLSEHPVPTDKVVGYEETSTERYSGGFVATLSYLGVSDEK